VKWAKVVNALLGIWFVVAPFVLGFGSDRGAAAGGIVGGAILFLAALWALRSTVYQRMLSSLMGLIGIWFLVFPFIFKIHEVRHITGTSVAGGLIALVLGIWLASASAPREAHA
jgi:hypothetical protein